jgi:hypothetical protein
VSRGFPTAVGYNRGRPRIGWTAQLAADLGMPARYHTGFVTGLRSTPGGTGYPSYSLSGHSGDASSDTGSAAEAAGNFLAAVLASDSGSVGEADRLVIAVPDSWLVGADGAAARETVRTILVNDLDAPLGQLVSRSHCLAASVAADWFAPKYPGPPVEYRSVPPPVSTGSGEQCCLICDITADSLVVALFAVDVGRVGLVDLELDQPARAHHTADAFVRRMLRLSRPDATGTADGGVSGRDDAGSLGDHTENQLVDRLRRTLSAALETQRPRAEVVLRRAAASPRYGDTPVYWFGHDAGDHRLIASQVLDGFEPVQRSIAASVTRLLLRHTDRARRATVLISGELAALPLVADAVRAGLGTAGPTDVSIRRLDPGAAAYGAVLVAAGDVDAADRAAFGLAVPVHRVVRGEPTDSSILLARPLAPVPLVTSVDGQPAIVELPGAPMAPLSVHVLPVDGAGRTVTLGLRAHTQGPHSLGHWPARRAPGTIALRPVGGGPTVLTEVEAG